MIKNILIKGENLDGLRYLIEKQSLTAMVDLCYIDPPFATNSNFTITNGRASTISNSKNGDIAYSDKLLGADFIEYIRVRLELIKILLSDRGSVYLHTDYKIGHYLKVMMDEVFGIENFRNDITRIKCNPKNFSRVGYGNQKDLILFYSKGRNPIWNEPIEKYTNKDIEKLYPKIDKQGKRYTTVPIHAPGETSSPQPFKGKLPPPGRHWRTDIETMEAWDKHGLIEWSENGNPRKIVYACDRDGKRVQDIWGNFKDPQYPNYPTEKNADLLDLIIKTSSEQNSIVLDCFCGSGTTLRAAEKNGRAWIGIDKSDLAIDATENKLSVLKQGLFAKDSYQLIKI